MVSTDAFSGSTKALTVLSDFDGGSAPIYIGEAQPGTATSKTKWRIQKRTYSNRKLTAIEWADGDGNFDKEWDERKTGTYTYS